MKLFHLNYNNYFNRIAKIEKDIPSYLQYKVGEESDINFYPNDYVTTTHVCNLKANEVGDYLLATDDYQESIKSRWFIMEAVFLREGQFKLTLKRDLMADFRDSILTAPALIEKATLLDNDPMIYNREPVEFNQIKKSETPLMDETHSAWVVGYVPRDAMELQDTTKPWSENNPKHEVFPSAGRPIKGEVVMEGSQDITVASLADWEFNKYQNETFKTNASNSLILASVEINNTETFVGFDINGNEYSPDELDYNNLNKIKWKEKWLSLTTTGHYVGQKSNLNWKTYASGAYTNTLDFGRLPRFNNLGSIINNLKSTLNESFFYNLETEEKTRRFMSLNNKIIHETSSGNYYRVRLSNAEETIDNQYHMPRATASLIDSNMDKRFYSRRVKDPLLKVWTYETGTIARDSQPVENSYIILADSNYYKLVLEQVQVYIGCDDFGANRYHLDDQPFDMFCIPIGNLTNAEETIHILEKSGNTYVDNGLTPRKEIALNIGTIISKSLGAGNIFDIQLLPYCPISNAKGDPGTIKVDPNHCNYIYKYDDQGARGEKLSVILWATHSSFSFNIYNNIPVTEKKIQNQCDLYRLCSPNYNGLFDFNVARNDGVEYFNVDCSYKPFSPYIHINPNFKGLYGKDFNGTRGLICGGDFSLPQISNAWANYQMNNKNYATMFDKEIKHLDTQRGIERTGQIVGAIAGTISGGTMGAIAGGSVGGLIGGVASGLGGIADIALSDKAYKDNKDFKTAIHNLQLDNIKALPESLSKVSAFTYNNKIFPFLEYYTCTAEEKEAFRNMLKYDGMTVGRIGNIIEFIRSERTFIQAKMIRLEDIFDDYHIVSEIYKELSMGIYI